LGSYKHDIGIRFNMMKTGMIKSKGVWHRKLSFLGSVFDPWKNTLNDIPIEKINHRNIFKIVGKVYKENKVAKEWDWEFRKDSLLYRVHVLNRWHYLLYKLFRPIALKSGFKKWDHYLPISSGSTICSALLLSGINRNSSFNIRKIRY
jgi:hypothetical protein